MKGFYFLSLFASAKSDSSFLLKIHLNTKTHFMRKFRLLSVLSLTMLFIISSCSKEGPAGPTGATGPQGPAGPQGPQGTTNVTYSTWYTTLAADWSAGGVAPYFDVFKYVRTAPGVTQAIIDNGLVLAYMKDWIYDSDGSGTTPLHSSTTVQLPFYADVNYTDYWDFAIPAAGSIRFMYKSQAPWDITVMPGVSYRYVIIPGSIAGGRGINGETTYEGYSADELKSMSYDQVAQLFNIPGEGTNIRW